MKSTFATGSSSSSSSSSLLAGMMMTAFFSASPSQAFPAYGTGGNHQNITFHPMANTDIPATMDPLHAQLHKYKLHHHGVRRSYPQHGGEDDGDDGQQYLKTPVDITGDHAFQPPDYEAGDQRGPCPALNAMANHGYLPRNGVITFTESIQACHQVFGLGLDLSTLLTTLALVGVGNPLSLSPGYSIGGVSDESQNLLGNLLGLIGTPQGLDGAHNWVEVDASSTRGDLYLTGDASALNMTLFEQLLSHTNSLPGKALTLENLGDWSMTRFRHSIATNPNFYYGPMTGTINRSVGYALAGRLLSNHSAEFPTGGQLTEDVLKAFWGVYDSSPDSDPDYPTNFTDYSSAPSPSSSSSSSYTTQKSSDGKLIYKKGHERIPENWYRTTSSYDLYAFNVDLISWVKKYPVLGSVGGNMGTVNSFTGVDTEDLTGGVLNGKNALLRGNNLMCFALQMLSVFASNELAPLFKTLQILQKPLGLLNDAVGGALGGMECPTLQGIDQEKMKGVLEKFPGAKRSGFFL